MFFAILTLITALALAGVAGWFSIIGMMAIFAAAPMHALILGCVLESGKLVTTSWLYRNWDYANWKLKAPLITFTLIIMLTTSIGVFGFLSKGHLEQGASTLDNGAKVERINQQIARENTIIADNEKVIAQLDATVNSYLGRDRADRSVVIRRSQAPQRQQLRTEIDAAHKKIDAYNEEKFALESEVRKLELEVGPIRYIAEVMYGTEDSTKNIESAVRMFILLIVLTLDPLAVILLIAANHTILRKQNEKKEAISSERSGLRPDDYQSEVNKEISTASSNTIPFSTHEIQGTKEIQLPQEGSTEDPPKASIPPAQAEVHEEVFNSPVEVLDEKETSVETSPEPLPPVSRDVNSIEEIQESETVQADVAPEDLPQREDKLVHTEVSEVTEPWAQQESVLRELLGNNKHFIPQKVNEETNPTAEAVSKDSGNTKSTENSGKKVHQTGKNRASNNQGSSPGKNGQDASIDSGSASAGKKIKALSWLNEFRR